MGRLLDAPASSERSGFSGRYVARALPGRKGGDCRARSLSATLRREAISIAG